MQFTILASSSTRAINKLIPRCTLRVIFCLFFVLQLLTSNSMSRATWLDLKLVRMGSLVSWNCLWTYLLNYHCLCHNRCLSWLLLNLILGVTKKEVRNRNVCRLVWRNWWKGSNRKIANYQQRKILERKIMWDAPIFWEKLINCAINASRHPTFSPTPMNCFKECDDDWKDDEEGDRIGMNVKWLM